MEVYFCEPRHCSCALSEQPRMDTLKDFKNFLSSDELAQEEVRVAEETEEREKAAKRIDVRNEDNGAARDGECHRNEGGEEKG